MTCDVIRDLMPLCADGVASEESRAAVEEHIRTCAACRALYESMCAPVEAQEPAKEPDYMDAVRQQKKENRRFILRVYGIALGLVLLFGAMWLIDQMMRYQHWTYDRVPVSQEYIEKVMPQTLLTAEEKALAKVIFSLPEVQPYLTDVSLPPSELPEEVVNALLTAAGKNGNEVSLMWSYAAETCVYLAYTEGEYRHVLEYYDTDRSGYSDVLRKMTCEKGEDVKTLYYAEINAALIGAAGTDNAEENQQYEDFNTTYEKVSGKRLWLDFLKRYWEKDDDDGAIPAA